MIISCYLAISEDSTGDFKGIMEDNMETTLWGFAFRVLAF